MPANEENPGTPDKPPEGADAGDSGDDDGGLDQKQAEQEKFTPEEEAGLVGESNAHKAEANSLFSTGKYNAAITKYEEAVAVCPNYLDFEVAVLRSNISACHLKLEEWKEAVASATAALDGLDRLEKRLQADSKEKQKVGTGEDEKGDSDDEVDEEIISSGASKAAPALPVEDAAEAERRKREDDVMRIRAKALMRRARARSEEGGWSTLAGAEEDYKALSAMKNLGLADRKLVQAQLRTLPARTKAAQEREMGEMWGKLKELGNGLLKPFGLSTENFQMVQDENTGGYSMNFKSGGK